MHLIASCNTAAEVAVLLQHSLLSHHTRYLVYNNSKQLSSGVHRVQVVITRYTVVVLIVHY